MLELKTIQIGEFEKRNEYKCKNKRNTLFKKVVHQSFWLSDVGNCSIKGHETSSLM